MGLFNGTNLSVEAILTTRGRELLSKDNGKINITKFALSDEEIDYTLYDTTHPNGDASFGTVIENTIPIEASPTRKNLKSYLIPVEQSFNNKKLNVPQDVTLEPDTLFDIIPITRNGGVEISEDYLFTIQNTNIISFVSDEENKNITNTFTGKKTTVNSNRINPSATTTITVHGLISKLTKIIIVDVKSDTSNQTTSPFNSNVVVTDSRYY
tara:strand:+ start:219 stop:851 length:633 start_codon:yes stop_codon:yes gene_type:complete